MVGEIDSFDILEKYTSPLISFDEDCIFKVSKSSEEMWEKFPKSSWTFIDQNRSEESGEPLGKPIIKNVQIGLSYLLNIEKTDLWWSSARRMYGDDDKYLRKSYLFSYGILLEADTCGTKVYPAGTYVLGYRKRIESSFYYVEYFKDWDKFCLSINHELRQMTELADWIAGYQPLRISIEY
ncbi:hypothetical protein GW758_00305 [Candidatus Falkowbacteria bacterium]|nr:hypothetical protein [Candidatus Falkowbacteria bacterium]